MPAIRKSPSRRQGQKTARHWLSIRISQAMREHLGEAANRTGRSLSAEAETRLERTLQGEGSFQETLDYVAGRQGGALVEILAFLMRRGGDWLDDPDAYADMRRKLEVILDLAAPGEALPTPTPAAEAEAIELLEKLFSVNPSALWFRWSLQLQRRLGPQATKRIMQRIIARVR
jgi:hypothetical protein